jgi:hypothetical protein
MHVVLSVGNGPCGIPTPLLALRDLYVCSLQTSASSWRRETLGTPKAGNSFNILRGQILERSRENDVACSSWGSNCSRCFHITPRSRNVLQMRTEGLDKCYTNEDAAAATCPNKSTTQFQDIILYSKWQDILPSMTRNTNRHCLDVLRSLGFLFRNYNEQGTDFLVTNNNNSMALVRELTIPTERPPLVFEVSANFSG